MLEGMHGRCHRELDLINMQIASIQWLTSDGVLMDFSGALEREDASSRAVGKLPSESPASATANLS